MAILDTSFLVDLLRTKIAGEVVADLEKKESALFITAPSAMELWTGALLSNVSEKEQGRVEEMLAAGDVLPFTGVAAKKAGEVQATLIRKGVKIDPEDIMIAAIAMVRGEPVVTKDEHFARIPGLNVLKY